MHYEDALKPHSRCDCQQGLRRYKRGVKHTLKLFKTTKHVWSSGYHRLRQLRDASQSMNDGGFKRYCFIFNQLDWCQKWITKWQHSPLGLSFHTLIYSIYWLVNALSRKRSSFERSYSMTPQNSEEVIWFTLIEILMLLNKSFLIWICVSNIHIIQKTVHKTVLMKMTFSAIIHLPCAWYWKWVNQLTNGYLFDQLSGKNWSTSSFVAKNSKIYSISNMTVQIVRPIRNNTGNMTIETKISGFCSFFIGKLC